MQNVGTTTADKVLTLLFEAARRNKDNNNFDECNACCLAIITLDPLNVDARMLQADNFRESLKPNAYECYVELTKIQNGNLWAHMYLGFHYSDIGLHNESRAEFLAAIEINPDLREAYFELGRAYVQLEQFDLALAAFNQMGPTKVGYWLSTASNTERLASEARARIHKLIGSRRVRHLTNEEVHTLAADLLRLGRLKAVCAVLNDPDTNTNDIQFHKTKYLYLRRAASSEEALAYLTRVVNDGNVPPAPQMREFLLNALYENKKYKELYDIIASSYNEFSPSLTIKYVFFLARASNKFVEFKTQIFSLAKQIEINSELAQIIITTLFGAGELSLYKYQHVNAITAPNSADIPFHIVQYWNDNNIPNDVSCCMSSWVSKNPGMQQVVFCKATARDFIQSNYSQEILLAFDRCHHPAMESDFFRLAYLVKYGGIYIDADEECAKSIWGAYQSWKANDIVLVASPRSPYYLMNGFLAARQKSEILERALTSATADINSAFSRGVRPNIWHVTGPGLITRSFARTVIEKRAPPEGIVILSFQNYRRICHERSSLEYKLLPKGNWRFS